MSQKYSGGYTKKQILKMLEGLKEGKTLVEVGLKTGEQIAYGLPFMRRGREYTKLVISKKFEI